MCVCVFVYFMKMYMFLLHAHFMAAALSVGNILIESVI